MKDETEPRHMTIAEVEEKLATIDAKHKKTLKAQEVVFANDRKDELARLAEIRKEYRADQAAFHKAQRAKLAAYLDVLKMEGEE